MKPYILLPGLLLILAILFTGCLSEKTGTTTPGPVNTSPIISPPTTPATPAITGTGVPLITPGAAGVSIQATPGKYSPLMSSTVGIGLTPIYTGTGQAVYSWNTSYGYFVGWNAPDWKVDRYGQSLDSANQTIYWSYSPDDMGKEKPPVTIRLIVKTPPRDHGGNGTIAWKDLHITWENNDTAVVAQDK
jgi:hypothetical protein